VPPGHFSRKLAAASSKAFFCAEEPSAFRVPSKHSADAAEPVAEELDYDADPVLSSEPQPARAIEPTRARAATWPRRVFFTVCTSRRTRVRGAGDTARHEER
jgi:hypothetical protein